MNRAKRNMGTLFSFLCMSIVVMIVHPAMTAPQEGQVENKTLVSQEAPVVTEQTKKAAEVTTGPLSQVVAYYFHGTQRCASCQRIEKWSREAIEKYFAKELKDGTLEFRLVNVDKKENRHFIKDYELYTKSLVLVLMKSGQEVKHKNLKDVWLLLRNQEKFFQYVKAEVEKFLEEAS